jgi:hypothetical protein
VNCEPQLVPTLISPLGFLRDQGYRIDRLPDEWEWWSLSPPATSWRKPRRRCTLGTIVQIAAAEGWEPMALQPASDTTKPLAP